MSKQKKEFIPPEPGWVCEYAIDTTKEYRNLKFCKRCRDKIGHYAFKMIHPDHGYLWVDQICAYAMAGKNGLVYAKRRQEQLERYYKEKEERKRIFKAQRWRPTRYGGIGTFYFGCSIIVYPAENGKYAVICHGKRYFDLEGNAFPSEQDAKDAAFYIYEGLPHEPFELHAAYEYRLLRYKP